MFRQPVAVITSRRIEQVIACLQEVEAGTRKGLYAAGFLSYEAAPAMDPALETRAAHGLPLIWFGLYRPPEIVALPATDAKTFEVLGWQPSISLNDYRESIGKIKQRIEYGDTYQVNYTHRLRARFRGDAWALFLELQNTQRGCYSAYLNLGNQHICSVSPELFFSLKQGELTCKPMKGTAMRGLTTTQDREHEQWLVSSQKNRAEHIMIVDMIRNDLGKIAETGSVKPEKLFCVEKYPTVMQMTSTVTSRSSAPLSEIFRGLFPCASITGAPKVKTMQIIKYLEPSPRGVYTGSIGYIAPDGSSQFNVAIRTAVIDMDQQSAEYGVGGGIVWDSNADDEYQECQTKARVLFNRQPEFELLETILWISDRGLYLLDLHLKRLQDSAAYFQFALDVEQLQKTLREFAFSAPIEKRRIRVTVSRIGDISMESSPLLSIAGSKLGMARRAVREHSPFLSHKTTYRKLYSELLDEECKHQADITDVIAWNDKGFITDSTIANVVIARDGDLFTPALDVDLLPGVFRQQLLQASVIKEKSISVDELLNAQEIFLVNSLRGWMPLDNAVGEATWRIRSDFNYEMAAPSLK